MPAGRRGSDLVTPETGARCWWTAPTTPPVRAALEAYVRSEWPDGLPLVFGAMRDKPAADMLRPLATIARPLILTTAPGPRAADAASSPPPPDRSGSTILVCPDIPQALAAGWERAARIAAAGSLYLAGEVLRLLDRA